MSRFTRSLLVLLTTITLTTTLLSQPTTNINLVGRIRLGLANSLSMVIAGNYAYLATSYTGLLILNVSNPATPIETGSCVLYGSAQHVAVNGDLAVVTVNDSMLYTVDISNHTNPVQVGFCNLHTYAHNVTIHSNYAYVVTVRDGIKIVSIADAGNPVEVGNYPFPDYLTDIKFTNNYALVAAPDSGLLVLEASDPVSLTRIARLDTIGGVKIQICGNVAYTTNVTGLYILDISDPASITVSGHYPAYSAYQFAINGNRAYMTDAGFGVFVLDISNPAQITRLDTNEVLNFNWPQGIAVKDSIVYVLGGPLTIVSVSDDYNPVQIGNFNPGISATSVAVRGNYAYLVGDSITIVDISNPQSPVIVNRCCPLVDGNKIKIQGDYAYIATIWSESLYIYSLANPISPQRVGSISTHGYTWDLELQGNYAYVAADTGGFRMIDISNPANPTLNYVFREPSQSSAREYYQVYSLAVGGNIAAASSNMSGVHLLDISDSSNVTELGTCGAEGMWQTDIHGHYLFNENYIIDITDPHHPVRVCSQLVTEPYAPYSYTPTYNFTSNFAIITGQGLHVYDLTDAAHPVESGNTKLPFFPSSVTVSGNLAYELDYFLNIYDCTQALAVMEKNTNGVPNHYSLKQNYPNPFNSSTMIEYSLPKAGKVELRLYDVSGRVIETLINAKQTAGNHRLTFDASKYASGVYFYRLQAGDFVKTNKMVVMK